MDQYHYRLDLIMKALKSAQINILDLDAVVGRGGLLKPVTGGIAHSQYIVEKIQERVKFIASIDVFPSENEMAQGVLDVLSGRCKAKIYE